MKGNINMQKDYRIRVTIRNDRLLTAMEEMGYPSMAQFTQAHGLEYQRTGEIFNGKLKPLNKKGDLIPLAKEILNIEVQERPVSMEEVLEAANKDDLNPFYDFLKVLEKPYENQIKTNNYQSPAPPSEKKYQTFCGT